MPGKPKEESLSRRRVCGQLRQMMLNGQMIMRTKTSGFVTERKLL